MVAGLITILAAVYSGSQIPPCFGVPPTGQVTPECMASWRASRPIENVVGTPLGALLLFITLVAAVRVAAWVSRPRGDASR